MNIFLNFRERKIPNSSSVVVPIMGEIFHSRNVDGIFSFLIITILLQEKRQIHFFHTGQRKQKKTSVMCQQLTNKTLTFKSTVKF